jgi:hypothetical protein
MYAARGAKFRADVRNIDAAGSYMVQFHRHLRIRTMLTKPQPLRPRRPSPGWGPKF